MCMIIYIPGNVSMQRETIGKDGHKSHEGDDMEIADCTQTK